MFTDKEWEEFQLALREWARVCAASGGNPTEVFLSLQPGPRISAALSMSIGNEEVFADGEARSLPVALKMALDRFAELAAARGSSS